MPAAIPKPCAKPGCPNITTQRHCPAHAKEARQRYDSQRRDHEARRFYASTRWRKVRAMVLARDPICQECHRAASTTAAHIIPRKDAPDLELDLDNIRGLCGPCHSRESAVRGERWD